MSWFYSAGGEQKGPVELAEFESLISTGVIRPETLVWQPGMPNWQPVTEVRPDLLPPPLGGVPQVQMSGQCSVCGTPQSPENLINFNGRMVCANCKPRVAQGLALGVDPGMAPQRYAGFWIRFVARLIDGILLTIIQLALGFAVGTVAGDSILVSIVVMLISFALAPTYEAVMTIQHRATLGKMAVGVRIMRVDGSPLTYGRVIGRYFAQILSALILMIGYIMAAFDVRKQALHDRLCDTVVVYDK